MYIQISSGQGPVECQRVVWLVHKKLISGLNGLKLFDSEKGYSKNCYKSITLACDEQISLDDIRENWLGTIQWRGPSPFRPNHKRKNWFVKVSLISIEISEVFDPSKVEFQAFRGSGPGGQHVNTSDSAVRAIYMPSGMAVTSSEQRSQFLNKQSALLKLKKKLEDLESEKEQSVTAGSRMLHYQLERGNPVKILNGKL